MNEYIITGIQQIGIGVEDLKKAWKYYIDVFGMDIRVLEDNSVAELMLPYTGNKPQKRHAVIAINMHGGGGFEVWQYTERKPLKPTSEIQFGDLGIFAAKLKSSNIEQSYEHFSNKKNVKIVSSLQRSLDGKKTFFIIDPFGHHFQIVEEKYIFRNEKKSTGGVVGAIIGVSDIDKAMEVYGNILGYDKIIADEEGMFNDINTLIAGEQRYKRRLLTHSMSKKGALSNLMGPISYIELVQSVERTPKKIFENRFWGDVGFIHLCFDISNMDALRSYCDKLGYAFTADSAGNFKKGESFDMGDAAGQFAYIEDPDGTLIEFVETHKIPILKKLNLSLDLKKRSKEKPLPNWMLKSLRFGRVYSNKL